MALTFNDGALQYELWSYRSDTKSVGEDRLESLIGSGEIAVSNTMSAAVTVPDAGPGRDVVLRLRNLGTYSPMFVHITQGAAPAGTGAPAAVDAQPRLYLDGERKTALVNVVEGGAFAAVLRQVSA